MIAGFVMPDLGRHPLSLHGRREGRRAPDHVRGDERA
jgi:hypothetical protein